MVLAAERPFPRFVIAAIAAASRVGADAEDDIVAFVTGRIEAGRTLHASVIVCAVAEGAKESQQSYIRGVADVSAIGLTGNDRSLRLF